jgi:peptide/nickel transport system ATP-binding protein
MFAAYPHQLSGGQKQRVMIAMAIACKPALLIADEPTTALDVTVQQSILDLLLDLKSTYNMGMIFITHDLGVVAQVAQNVMVMQKGEMIEKGNVLDLFKAPKQPYTKGLIACKPPLNIRPERLLTVSDFLSNDSEKITIKNITTAERENTLTQLYQQPPLLQVKNLSTRFVTASNMWGVPTQYLNALNQINFDVFKGETIGLVGESGCGKSTLGRSILRLTPAFEGEVIYNKVNLFNLSSEKMREMRSKMQLIFQDPYSSLNPRITIGAAIEEPMIAHHLFARSEERKEAVLALIKRVGLNENFYNRYPHEFSGGQRQRIGIARTLALKPEFIVCDESVSALDVSVQAQVLNLLNELKHDFNLTYIFISHDLSVVKYMCDRMIVMRNGIIEEIGDADTIYKNPQSDYTRSLINAIPKMANMTNA